jgi:predicted HD phosphohydrolase
MLLISLILWINSERRFVIQNYEACVDSCADWDQPSFDPDYDSLPLEYFIPLVETLFARSAQSLV